MTVLRPRLAKNLAFSCAALFLAGMFFRFAIYRHIHIAPDAPFGISDLVEAVLGLLLMAVLAVSALSSVAMLIHGPRENKVAGAWLLVTCLAIV